jgi:ATP-dependent DNA ligase
MAAGIRVACAVHVCVCVCARVCLQEEGIVAKQLDSLWKADDKSGTWLKLKPDYFHMQEVRT